MSKKLPASLRARVVELDVDASLPYLRRGPAANQFQLLREEVKRRVGYDFLGKVELLRTRGYISKCRDVHDRSRHICGDAFDFDASSDRYLLVSEPDDHGNQFWRVFIRSNFEHGKPFSLECNLVGNVFGHFVDFTKLAGKFGFVRIPAWPGWSHVGAGRSLREFWHYQLLDDLTWDEGVTFLYGRHRENRPVRFALNDRTYGLNDRGRAVMSLQMQLAFLEMLNLESVAAGVFGLGTCQAVKAFQRKARLSVTGLADPGTRRALAQDVIHQLSVSPYGKAAGKA